MWDVFQDTSISYRTQTYSVLNSLYTGVDSTQLEMSLSTAWQHRRSGAEHLAATEISSFMEAVQESATRILVQFDEKDLEQDIDGKVIEIENQSLKFEPDR